MTDAPLDSLLAARYSCRAFLPDEVDEPTIRHMLALAQRAPSWCNVQPWQVVLTSGAATRAFSSLLMAEAMSRSGRFDVEAPAEYLGVYRDRRRASGYALYESLSIARDDREARTRQALENFRFFGAPHVALITTEAQLGPYALVDTGGYISTLLLAAASAGLGAIAQAAVASHSEALRGHFGIPDSRHVVCAVAFGYADDAHPANAFRTGRAEFEEVVSWIRD